MPGLLGCVVCAVEGVGDIILVMLLVVIVIVWTCYVIVLLLCWVPWQVCDSDAKFVEQVWSYQHISIIM